MNEHPPLQLLTPARHAELFEAAKARASELRAEEMDHLWHAAAQRLAGMRRALRHALTRCRYPRRAAQPGTPAAPPPGPTTQALQESRRRAPPPAASAA